MLADMPPAPNNEARPANAMTSAVRRQRLVRLLSPKANTSAQAELLRCNRGRFTPRLCEQTRPSTPTQIVIAEWKRADALAGDFENRLGNGGCHLLDCFLADSRNP